MSFGEPDGQISERGEHRRDRCEAAGFEGVLSPDILVPVWEKFVMLVPVDGLYALTRLPIGNGATTPTSSPFTRGRCVKRSLWAVPKEFGCLPRQLKKRDRDDALDAALFNGFDGHGVICGNRLELPWFSGKVVELGRRH